MESPQECRSRRYFDQAIQTESDQRHGPGDHPSHDGGHSFEAVVTNGEVFQPPAAAYILCAICAADPSHVSIMRDSRLLEPANGSTALPYTG